MYVSFSIGKDVRHGIKAGEVFHQFLGNCAIIQTPRSLIRGQIGDIVELNKLEESNKSLFDKHFDEVAIEEIKSARQVADKIVSEYGE